MRESESLKEGKKKVTNELSSSTHQERRGDGEGGVSDETLCPSAETLIGTYLRRCME